MARRRTGADGVLNKLTYTVLTLPIWWPLQRVPLVGPAANRIFINLAVKKGDPRPYALSTRSVYTTWRSLTDKRSNARQLPPVQLPALPEVARVNALFVRDETIPCPKSSVLFAYLAQWFTDGFLRSKRPGKGEVMRDINRNESNHEVDLGQLYGLDPRVTEALRAKTGGLLKCDMIDGEEFPPKLYDASGDVKREFRHLPRVVGLHEMSQQTRLALKPHLYAMGSDVANTHIGYAMLNILFLREHNRIARILADQRELKKWDDERLFQTARNILTVRLIKLVIEEYINHIAPYRFKFKFDPQRFYRASWYRPNWVAVEFNLLYRWHSLIPSKLDIGRKHLTIQETSFGNALIEKRGLGRMFDDASKQRAGKICLFNTDKWFHEPRDAAAAPKVPRTQSVEQARKVELATYNAYREDMNFPPVTRYDQISSNPKVIDGLREVYGDDPAKIEFYVGLFAEDTRPNSVLPPLMGAMVGLHAFSQLMTNPLVSPNVYGSRRRRKETFSAVGARMIRNEVTLQGLLNDNVKEGSGPFKARLTHPDWRRDTAPRRAASMLRGWFPRARGQSEETSPAAG